MSRVSDPGDTALGELLEPLLAEPGRAAVLTDIDGTLAAIAERPDQAGVPGDAQATLAELSGRFGLVGCVSGRGAAEARRLVGLDGIAYAGNHGLELLLPGEERPHFHPSLEAPDAAAAFLAGFDRAELAAAELRVEDKGPVQALHWRGAEEEPRAEARARQVATEAERIGLHPHWGRKVLELRPLASVGKDAAVASMLASATVRAAIYGGDDTTDLDAFRGLRELRRDGALDVAVCIGIGSAEAPPGLAERADLIVDGPPGWLAVLKDLAG